MINKSDIITTDKYLSFCVKNNLMYIKTDYFYIGAFNWRGKMHPGKEIGESCVIGHSDYPVTSNISDKFKYVFCVNKDSESSNTFGIPLGITNDTDESPVHRIIGNTDVIIDIINRNVTIDNLAYMNFNIGTFPTERQSIYNMFYNKDWIKIDKLEVTQAGYQNYLMGIKSCKFVICPRGNGIDTHRLWEALYMGSIPIVKYENAHQLFTDLPILFISDWSIITEEYLNVKYKEIKNKQYNINKLKISYWEKFICKIIKAE
tara:strand:+ start:2815 stop:3597 length:783 start_codon:yes stop_codon:yes gene_type:complete